MPKTTVPVANPEAEKAFLQLLSAATDGDLARAKAAVAAGAKFAIAGKPSPLCAAAKRGHAKVVAYLLERGADPRSPGETGENALQLAAAANHPAALEAFRAAGIALDVSGADGRAALCVAVAAGSTKTAALLLGIAAPLAQSAHAEAASAALLHAASMPAAAYATGTAAALLQLLHAAGADAHCCTSAGDTLLHLAAKNSAVPADFLAVLLAFGLAVDTQDASGCTALWHAARTNQMGKAQVLLAGGADVHLRSRKTSPLARIGTSVQEIARELGSLALLEVLRNAATSRPQVAAAPAPDSVPEEPSASCTEKLEVGAQVTHAKFGAGIVTAVGMPDSSNPQPNKFTVDFAGTTRVVLAQFLTLTTHEQLPREGAQGSPALLE